MKNPSILIISYYFAPKNEIAAIRLTKLAKFFVRNGWNVSVLTFEANPYNSYENRKDDTLISPELKNINIEYVKLPMILLSATKLKNRFKFKRNKLVKNSINDGLAKFDNKNLKNNSIKKSIFHITYFIYDLFVNYLLTLKARRHINKLLINHNPNVIFSSFGPFSSISIGKYAKKQSPQSHWLVDLRDSVIRIADHDIPSIYRVKKKMEKNILLQSNSLTVVSKGMKESILERHKGRSDEFMDKIRIFTNGYDMEDLNMINQDEKIIDKDGYFNICYVGRLYDGKSKVHMLAKGILELSEEKMIELNRIKIHYAGASFNLFKAQLSEYGIENILVNHGLISRKRSLQLQKECDLLLMLTWNDKNDRGIITGKLLEYMMIKKPVLAIISGNVQNSEVKSIIDSCKIGRAFEEANFQDEMKDLKDFLFDSFNQIFDNGKIFYKPNQEELLTYSYENISGNLSQYLLNNID